ncbi:MAG TPA: hypothetical protein VGR43_05850, partial [Dehalococcoidia bacterium]|nr:hypothetical protein [Dehalococcoidia bacterium]
LYSEQALRLGTKDALLLFHAGMIAHKLGDLTSSRQRLQQAIDLNPHFSVPYAKEAASVLSEQGVGAYQR